MKESVSFTQSELDTLKEKAKENTKEMKDGLEDLSLKVAQLEKKLESAVEENIKLEQYTRRENLRFNNITEYEGEDCKALICGVIQNEMGMDASNINFHAVHRVGKKIDNRCRPIIARFISREDRNEIWKNRGFLNVRGLGDRLKRREMFNWLRRKKFSIYMLQEVHCSEFTIPVWSAEWGYKTIFSCCTSAKGGVAILFNNNFAFQLERTYVDPNGRFIICDITTDKKCVTIATLYAPNEDDPDFFSNFFDHLNDFECDDVIIGGDFNLVLNLDVDKKGGLTRTHTKSVKALKELCAELDLVAFSGRMANSKPGQAQIYVASKLTWRSKRPEIQCRLDFFLVTQSLMCNVKSANIATGYKTDHSLIEIIIATHSNERGPSFWKLNTSLLSEIDYINQIRDTKLQK
ncbi:hypothetical protein ACROYT_G007630 [Oculina patagonica]